MEWEFSHHPYDQLSTTKPPATFRVIHAFADIPEVAVHITVWQIPKETPLTSAQNSSSSKSKIKGVLEGEVPPASMPHSGDRWQEKGLWASGLAPV